MTNRQNRRSFMSVLTSLAGMAALESTGTAANAQPAGVAKRDLAWIDDLNGRVPRRDEERVP